MQKLALVALALLTPSTQALVCDEAVAQTQCLTPFNDAETAGTDKCKALDVYAVCITNWATTGECKAKAKEAVDPNPVTVKTEQAKATVADRCKKGCTGTAACGTITTTLTPWDSSYASGSDSLGSLFSSSLKEDSTGDSSGSQASSGESSGMFQSGSSGSYMFLWQWLVLLALLCGCLALAAVGMKPKPQKKKIKTAPKPSPAPAPEVELAPLLIPAYSAPVMEYAMPMTTSMAYAAPATTAYAAPMTYAAPATTAYAAPMTYAAPATTAYAAPAYGGYGGYPGTVV